MCPNPTHATPSRVRLYRCEHGAFHLTVNHTTLHLDATELSLLGQAIGRWAQRHPEWVQQFLTHVPDASAE